MQTESEVTRVLKRMTPARRLRAAAELFQTAWELKAAGVKMRHPAWDIKRIKKAVRDFFLYARS